MTQTTSKGSFTGRHMVGVMVFGFGIVIAVNFYMASLAVGGFHGIVVDNSYVASQKFNDWIEEAKADRALGWKARAERDDAGFVTITTDGVPDASVISADLRRPIGEKDFASLTFVPQAGGTYRSTDPVKDGRWTMRLSITSGEQSWSAESELR